MVGCVLARGCVCVYVPGGVDSEEMNREATEIVVAL